MKIERESALVVYWKILVILFFFVLILWSCDGTIKIKIEIHDEPAKEAK